MPTSEPTPSSAAFAIANSPLVKTAVFGGDANWGRVAMAIGKSGARVDAGALRHHVRRHPDLLGRAPPSPSTRTPRPPALAERDVDVIVDLHLGDAEATVWTCDLTYDYVRINGEYRS